MRPDRGGSRGGNGTEGLGGAGGGYLNITLSGTATVDGKIYVTFSTLGNKIKIISLVCEFVFYI